MTSAPIRYLAIDDDPLDLLLLNEFSRSYDFLQHCGSFNGPVEGHEAIGYIKPDLVFLDIEMPGISGLEVMRKIRQEVPMTVFITSHAEFALEGFELSALDYILKPLTETRFDTTVRRIQEYWSMKQKSEAYEVLFEKDMLTIKEGYRQVRVSQRDIIYLEAMQDYTKIVTAGKNYLTLSSLSYFMEQLPAENFMRVHRSYAVSISKIRQLDPNGIICDNKVIPVGKTYRSAVARIKF